MATALEVKIQDCCQPGSSADMTFFEKKKIL